jgi:dolichol kinase
MEKIKTKSDFHFLRKLWHAAPGISVVLILQMQLLPKDQLIKILSSIYLLATMTEMIRLSNDTFNSFLFKFAKFVMREEEKNRPSGLVWYLFSVTGSLYFLPTELAGLNILYLAIGDPFASIVGLSMKDHPYNKKFSNGKSLFGSIGLSLMILNITLLYGYALQLPILPLAYKGLAACLVGFLTEMIPFKLDDNLLIPLFTGIALYSVSFYF